MDGDPLKDITSVRRVVFVMKGGKIWKDKVRAPKCNWLVIGIGDISRRRVIPAILSEPRSRLHSILTRDPAKAREYPDAHIYTNLDDALVNTPRRCSLHRDAQYPARPTSHCCATSWQACPLREACGAQLPRCHQDKDAR